MTLFTKKGTLKATYKKAVLSRESRETYGSFQDYLTKQDIPVDLTELTTLRTTIESSIEEDSLFFAHLSYFLMEQTQEWSDAGEQQVKAAFCRNVLNIPPSIPLNYTYVQAFENKCHEMQKHFGISHLSLVEAQKKFEDFSFTILGLSLGLHDIATIHDILRFLESDYYLQGGFYGHQRELIYGKGPHQKRGEYDVVTLTVEICRTPNTVMSMVAVIGDDQIYIRREAIESIFYQKWMPHAEHPHAYQTTPEYTCSVFIKNQALAHYGAKTSEELLSQKEAFIHDVGANILHHELGHGIIQHHVLPQGIGSVAEATKICGETVSVALLEILAEMAPHCGELWGPLVNMCEEAKHDVHVGSRDFWVYFSDAWFFDTEDTHLYTYSELMSLVMVSSLNSEKKIDFEKLSQEMTYRNEYWKIPKDQKTLLEWALSAVHDLVAQLKEIAEKSTYTIENVSYPFQEAVTLLTEKLNKECLEADEDSYAFETSLWSEIFDVLQKQPDDFQRLNTCFDAFELNLKQELLQKTSSADDYSQYKKSPKDYIYKRILN